MLVTLSLVVVSDDCTYSATNRQWTYHSQIALVDNETATTRRSRTENAMMMEDVLFGGEGLVSFILSRTRETLDEWHR